ncbi:MAG: phosphatidic acid phosphatase [Oscillospiraceae bacterium]|nr:phosphatidic acid phosphatase [Oscillospiraceae bacterium]
MKVERTPVSYRDLSPRTIREKRYSHLFLLLGWVGYFLLYTLTENLIPPEKCHVVHCALDDLIPFCEGFLIFYVSWYVLIVVSLLYFLRWDVPSFRKLQIFIMITQAVAMLIYILWPSRQDLRPEVFPRQNFLTWVMGIIYVFDTNTGVCPSLHVAYSIGIASVWLREKEVKPLWRGLIALLCVLISISTAFVKQHSVLDILAALPLGLLAEALVYGRWWKERLGKKKT